MDDGLAQDLVAMWQSELTAMAADRELREGWAALLALWAGAATAAMSAPLPRESSPRSARADEPARPPAAAPASDAGLDEIARLGRRVRELEQRLAEFARPDHRPQLQPRKRRAGTHHGTHPGTATPEASFAALAAADRQLVRGIATYRRSAYTRQLRDPSIVWEESESRLLNYAESSAGPVVLFVPSLINRAYILDLMPGGSMLRWLAAQGVRPYLLDWGWPGPVERQFSLTDYVAGRLERAIAALEATVTRPVVLAGYCMGGLLALAAALRCPARVEALALLATPWDFHRADEAAAKRVADTLALLEPMLRISGTLPIDVLQTLFTMIDPFGVGDKYRSFATLDQSTARAQRFIAMEDWLADGVPLAAPVARETLAGWYGGNSPARGEWRVAGLPVDPARLDMPSFCALPGRDRLVPPESARPLAALLKEAHVVEPAAGHIGMIAGTNAERALWRPFAAWLHRL